MCKIVQLAVICIALSFASIVFGSSSVPNDLLYFPHIASDATWETEIGIINVDNTQVTGTLYGYDNAGSLVESIAISLAVGGRKSLVVGEAFQNHSQISNMKFVAENGLCSGYEKLYAYGNRVAILAVSTENSGNIYVSHIASNSQWWTRLASLYSIPLIALRI